MNKRWKTNIKDFLNRKENMALITMAVILCVGIAVTNVKNQVPLHDGDVLVDSQNVAVETEAETEAGGEKEAEEETPSTLEQKRAALELERNELIAGYDETIENSSNESEQKNAIAQKERLAGYMEQEIAIERIIDTKNLPASLVIITDNMVTVTVDEQDLKQNVVTKICNVVMSETGRTADKIVIQSLY